MEVEAWLLAETTHLSRIDPSITLTAIQEQLSFDPSVEDLQQRPQPADDLNLCYAIAGQTYAKKNAQQTVSALDFTEIYFNTSSRFEDLKNLIQRIDVFLSAPPPNP
jgi:hypothetical protein